MQGVLFGVIAFIAVGLRVGDINAADDTTLMVGFEEFGAIRIGMTDKQAMRAYGPGLKVRPINQELESNECYVLHDPARLPYTEIWVWDHRIVGFMVGERRAKTFSGIGIGDEIAKVQSVYGDRIKIEPSHYDGMRAPDIWLRSSDGRNALRFQTENGKVRAILAGTVDAVSRVEGACL